jgi:acyl carrier protein
VEEIGTIAATILGRDRIWPDVDLFDQGATSLAYVRIIAEINERYQLSLNGSEVDGVATIERLALVVATALPSAVTSALELR